MYSVRQISSAAVFAAAMLSFASVASAQAKPATATASSSAGKSLTWGPAPDVFPAGAKMAVERGDPSKPGEFVVERQELHSTLRFLTVGDVLERPLDQPGLSLISCDGAQIGKNPGLPLVFA